MSVLAGVVAKLAALTVPAKASAAGIAVAISVTGGMAVHAVAAEPETPEVTDTTGDVVDDATDGTVVDDVADGDVDGEDDGDAEGTDDGDTKDLPDAADFGQSVAADARDGGVDGQEISERARERNAERAADRAGQPETPEAPEVEAPDTTVAPDAAATSTERGNGHGRP